MDEQRVLRVAIAAPAGDAGARGGTNCAGEDTPTVYQPERLLRLLSRRNMELLRIIRTAQPRSVAELGRLSGRPKASLMITLRRLQRAGIVAIRDVDGRRKVPELAADKFTVDVVLNPEAAA